LFRVYADNLIRRWHPHSANGLAPENLMIENSTGLSKYLDEDGIVVTQHFITPIRYSADTNLRWLGLPLARHEQCLPVDVRDLVAFNALLSSLINGKQPNFPSQ